MPGLKRVLRLAHTTCGQDSKLADGLSAELIAGVPPALPGTLWREFAVPGHGRLPDRATCRIAVDDGSPNAQHRAPEENPQGFVAAVREFLESLQTCREL